jgi:hypothetical protein
MAKEKPGEKKMIRKEFMDRVNRIIKERKDLLIKLAQEDKEWNGGKPEKRSARE